MYILLRQVLQCVRLLIVAMLEYLEGNLFQIWATGLEQEGSMKQVSNQVFTLSVVLWCHLLRNVERWNANYRRNHHNDI